MAGSPTLPFFCNRDDGDIDWFMVDSRWFAIYKIIAAGTSSVINRSGTSAFMMTKFRTFEAPHGRRVSIKWLIKSCLAFHMIVCTLSEVEANQYSVKNKDFKEHGRNK